MSATLDRRQVPALHPVQAPALPRAERIPLEGGGALYALRHGPEAVTQLQVLVPIGPGAPLAGTSLAWQMIQEGADGMDAHTLAERIAYYGAGVSLSLEEHYATLSLSCLTQFVPELLPLIEGMLERPAFDEGEWQTMRTRTLAGLRLREAQPGFGAQRALLGRLYGADHPYGYTPRPEAIEPIEVGDLSKVYGEHLWPATPTLLMAGQFSDSLLTTVARRLSRSGRAPEPLPAPAESPTAGGLGVPERIPYEQASQMSLRIGRRVPTREHADYAAMQFATVAFGGYFGSRLMRTVREELGLTYGISARIVSQGQGAHLVINSDLNRENFDAALDEIGKQARLMAATPLDEDERLLVRNYLTGQFATELGSPVRQASLLSRRLVLGLPDGYYEGLLASYDQLTPEQIQTAAATYLDPDTWHVVAAGPA